jgi:hypothetical protein
MFVPFSRILAMAMAAVLCFVLLVPLALQRHDTVLAIAVTCVFAVYAGANILLWRRYIPKP